MKKDMIINFAEKEVYGRTLIYCLDDDKSKHLQKLTGKKTFNESDLEALSDLGFKVFLQKIVI